MSFCLLSGRNEMQGFECPLSVGFNGSYISRHSSGSDLQLLLSCACSLMRLVSNKSTNLIQGVIFWMGLALGNNLGSYGFLLKYHHVIALFYTYEDLHFYDQFNKSVVLQI